MQIGPFQLSARVDGIYDFLSEELSALLEDIPLEEPPHNARCTRGVLNSNFLDI